MKKFKLVVKFLAEAETKFSVPDNFTKEQAIQYILKHADKLYVREAELPLSDEYEIKVDEVKSDFVNNNEGE